MEYNPLASSTPITNLAVILTIHARNSNKLYDGEKKYELRKSIPRSLPSIMFLYESDTKNLTGYVIIDGVISGPPSYVWEMIGEEGTTRERFFWYFGKSNVAYAFKVSVAVKFTRPLPLAALANIEPGFRPPQTFLYLENLPQLHSFLMQKMIEEYLFFQWHEFSSRPLSNNHEPLFIELFLRHISDAYLDSDQKHANQLISTDKDIADFEGIFTHAKRILEVYYHDELLGFVTVTLKYGGCLKTGPVILLEQFRNQGIGKKLRNFIHIAAIRGGFRKVYCTVPVKNTMAVQYLLASSYKIEGHLANHYHTEHDELVLAYSLADQREHGQEIIRPINSFDEFELVNSFSAEVFSLFSDQFNNFYFKMPDDWFIKQIELAALSANPDTRKITKDRYLFVANSNKLTTIVDTEFRAQAMALCIPKRGGSVKIMVLTRSSHSESLVHFINYIEDNVIAWSGERPRKIYSIVPVTDTVVVQAFWERGFKSEGVLDRPYNSRIDMLILSKIVFDSSPLNSM